jgi:ABC-type phosphate/phosphonate transport system substrate-binding protein
MMTERTRYGAPPRPKDAREAFAQVGEFLWGREWKAAMAHVLSVSRGYLSQVMLGNKPLNQDLIDGLRDFLAEQSQEEEARHIIKMIVLKRFETRPPKPAPSNRSPAKKATKKAQTED